MIIILEGVSKTGKTTLSNFLVKKYKFNYKKFSQPKGDPYVQYMKALKEVEKKGGHWIFDRFHWGEHVWGPLYRGKSGLSDEQFRNIELKALALNAHVIYCWDKVSNISKRFKEDKEDWEKTELILDALKLYGTVVINTILPVHIHRMRTKDDLLKTKRIEILISMYVDKGIPWKTIVGNTYDPQILFIGDTRNPRKSKYSKYGQPFDFGPSSKFLFNALEECKINLHEIAIINSDSKELRPFLNHFSMMSYPIVIAMGKNAKSALLKEHDGFHPYNAINHPSYEQRFHRHDSKFVNNIKLIIKS